MIKEKKYCYKHPLKEAKRRCYFCKKNICKECQLRLDKHIFCSKECHKKFKKTEKKEIILTFIKKKGKGIVLRIVLYSAVMMVFIISLLLNNYLDEILNINDESFLIKKNANKKEPDWTKASNIEIISPKDEELLENSNLTIKGFSPRESMVGLYINSEKMDALYTEDGNFLFENIPLKDRENVIQVRYFDNYGNNAYSKAIRVFLKSVPSESKWKQREEPILNLQLKDFLEITRAKEGKKYVYLTFDGGGNDNATDNIIKTLKENNIKATIFLTGEYIRKYPEKVRKLKEIGCVIGNHTFSHPHLTTFSFNGKQITLSGISREVVQSQLRKTEELYEATVNDKMAPYWRAPFGERNGEILKWAYELNYRHVHWTPTLDTLDWVSDKSSELFKPPKEILKKILKEEEKNSLDGGIILMHLGSEREGELRADSILKELIERVKEKGYIFKTIDETEWAKIKNLR